MAVLVGGMRAMDANAGGAAHGVFTDRPGTLSNDFFVNLIDMSTEWTRSATEGLYEGRERATGERRWTATPVDLIFGSHSELRSVAEFYAADDAQEDFVHDFVEAWARVMTLDRFDPAVSAATRRHRRLRVSAGLESSPRLSSTSYASSSIVNVGRSRRSSRR